MSSITYKIGNLLLHISMLDFGASINVMRRSIYDELNLGELNEPSVTIQQAMVGVTHTHMKSQRMS